MKLYENVVIGNFLYALGFAVRAKSLSTAVPSVINLLQQTPADKLLGDVLLEFPGVVRLIEFKDKKSSQKKERNKCNLLNIGIRKHKHHIKISKLIHWFIETDPLDPDNLEDRSFVSRITPYLDAYSETQTYFSFEEFIELTAQDAVSNKSLSNTEEISDYLWFLARFQGSKRLNTRGLLLVIDSSGGLAVANLTDMMELRLNQREF